MLQPVARLGRAWAEGLDQWVVEGRKVERVEGRAAVLLNHDCNVRSDIANLASSCNAFHILKKMGKRYVMSRIVTS